MTTFQIMSHNLQGMSQGHQRMMVRDYLNSLPQRPAVLSVQEHKLRAGKTDSLKHIWPDAHHITASALDGVHTANNENVIAGKGGVSLILSKDMAQYLHWEGSFTSQQATWATLVHPLLGNVGFIGVYAPNAPLEQAALWKEIRQEVNISYWWFMLGDVNMIEGPKDQKGGNYTMMFNAELHEWRELIRRLHLVDTFQRKDGELHFS
jgi:exonuclease III